MTNRILNPQALSFTYVSEGADGRSHFSEIAMPLDSGAKTLPTLVKAMQFKTSPEGKVVDYHLSPQRQWLLVMGGTVEITCADQARLFFPGDILFFDDLHGEGHRTVNVKGTRMLAHIAVPDGFSMEEFKLHR